MWIGTAGVGRDRDPHKKVHPKKHTQFVALLPLLALRLLLCAAFLPFVTAVAAALTRGCPPTAPLPPRRAAVARAFLSAWARFLLGAGFGVFPRCRGAAHAGAAPIYVFNHVSYLDGLLLAACLRAPAALAKAGVAAAPCLGPWTRALQCAYVDRADGAGGTVAALAARAADPRPWPPLAVAPEGTTKPARCVLRFRTGAFAAALAAGVPVVPVALDYAYTAVNPGWGVVASTLVHVLRLQAQVTTRATVTVLPPVHATPADTPASYAERVRRVLADALGAPAVDAGLEEWRALKAAGVAVDWAGRALVVGGRRVAPVVDVHAKEA